MADRKIIVSFRGSKTEIRLDDFVSAREVQAIVAESANKSSELRLRFKPDDIKLIFKGKILEGDRSLKELLEGGKVKKQVYRLVATGVAQTETETLDQEYQASLKKNAILVRDDLSSAGQEKERQRQRLGRKVAAEARRSNRSSPSNNYGFGKIETLPNLPDEAKARQLLTELANDPGIKACMEKHQWHVGSLAELYPEGKVGESEVCLMGLNRNKGQQILLRLRTDDLKGFRKLLSIREVLYHELAHNVHSEHDSNFFQLMRQIKKECLEMDWTNGQGVTGSGSDSDTFSGGTYALGGSKADSNLSPRELAARAALLRLTAEEEEVRRNCGCGH